MKGLPAVIASFTDYVNPKAARKSATYCNASSPASEELMFCVSLVQCIFRLCAFPPPPPGALHVNDGPFPLSAAPKPTPPETVRTNGSTSLSMRTVDGKQKGLRQTCSATNPRGTSKGHVQNEPQK
ncbi:hypothetical protein FKM82_026754 [Ascaphus truei]